MYVNEHWKHKLERTSCYGYSRNALLRLPRNQIAAAVSMLLVLGLYFNYFYVYLFINRCNKSYNIDFVVAVDSICNSIFLQISTQYYHIRNIDRNIISRMFLEMCFFNTLNYLFSLHVGISRSGVNRKMMLAAVFSVESTRFYKY